MLFSRLKQALGKLSGLFGATSNAPLETYETLLLEADVGVPCTALILGQIRNKPDPRSRLKEEILRRLERPAPPPAKEPPLIIMLSGVNGSGKTTTAAKLAHRYRQTGDVLLASCDTYRDAASTQLEIWARRTGVEIITSQKGQDAAAVAYDAVNKAMTRRTPTVIIDTAGRLHTRIDLMEELKKIKRVIGKLRPAGPDLNLLTIDSTLGQNSIQQARIFTKELAINGLILTKFDGTAKGGAIIPICQELNLPVLYLGIGEGIDDLVEFDAREFTDALFGDGDKS